MVSAAWLRFGLEQLIAQRWGEEIADAVVPKFSEMMRERVEANLRRTDNLDPRDSNYRVLHITNANTGMKIRELYRARPFTDDFSLPCRRVTRINAPSSMPLYSADRASLGQVFR